MLSYILVVVAAVAFATAEPECKEHMRTGMCPKIMMPVCASDGKTYNNECLFCYQKYQLQDVGADLRFMHDGRCEPKDRILRGCEPGMRKGCPKTYFPICASDGNTYNNLCMMCAHKFELQDQGNGEVDIHIIHDGRCESQPATLLRACSPAMRHGCPKNYRPVCASDGNTYNNLCMMCSRKYELMDETNENVDLYVVHDGRCESQAADLLRACSPAMRGGCPKNYRPICASDGNTYNNLCMMCARKYEIMDQTNGNVDLHVMHDGRC